MSSYTFFWDYYPPDLKRSCSLSSNKSFTSPPSNFPSVATINSIFLSSILLDTSLDMQKVSSLFIDFDPSESFPTYEYDRISITNNIIPNNLLSLFYSDSNLVAYFHAFNSFSLTST